MTKSAVVDAVVSFEFGQKKAFVVALVDMEPEEYVDILPDKKVAFKSFIHETPFTTLVNLEPEVWAKIHPKILEALEFRASAKDDELGNCPCCRM